MANVQQREAWNKGRLIGQKPPLKPKDIWAIRIHLQNAHAVRDLAMFNLAIDSKLRGCDLVNLHVRDVTHGTQILSRTMVIQRKTQRPVQFELTEPTRTTVAAWIEKAHLRGEQYLFRGLRRSGTENRVRLMSFYFGPLSTTNVLPILRQMDYAMALVRPWRPIQAPRKNSVPAC